jgi:serine/threonine-protein kinase
VQPDDPYGLAGQVLDGQFRVDRPVGEGGFSVVYRGKHLGLNEPIAIKCLKLPPRLGSAIVENFVRRFRDESKIHYKLSQASLHVARTIAAGTAMAPSVNALVPFMVLEWLEGYPLAEELRARRLRGEAGRPLGEVMRLLDPVAEALATAHGMGVVHRDLNPSNVFLARDAAGTVRPKVMDFGVAKVVSDHALALGPRTATLNQLRLFTPPYGAPEQFDDRLGAIGTWTDVYAFALVGVEMLTDRTPNEGDDLLNLMAQACDPARRPTPRARGAAVPDAVEEIFARALALDPTKRPVDVGEFWGHLKHVAADRAADRAARPATPARTARGTFILADPPTAQGPLTPPAYAPPAQSPSAGINVPAATPWPHGGQALGADGWPTPAKGTAAWGGRPAAPPSAGSVPTARASPADSWAVSTSTSTIDLASTHRDPESWSAPPWSAETTVNEDHVPTGRTAPAAPDDSRASPPSEPPPSHVDPFGPTVEGDFGRRGASPLSTTVKPGETRPDLFAPARPMHSPPATGVGIASTLPARRPPTPASGQPPSPGGGPFGPERTSGAPGAVDAPSGAVAMAFPAGNSPYGPPLTPAHGPAPYGPASPHEAPPYRPGATGPQAYGHAAPTSGAHAGRPSTEGASGGYNLPSGKVPLLPVDASLLPVGPTPSNLPAEPAATGRTKATLAWAAVALTLLTALAGVIYIIARALGVG